MADTVRLVTNPLPLRRVDLGPRRPRTPATAVVYATGDGELDLLDGGKPMRWSDQVFSRYRWRFEVDLTDHRKTIVLDSPALPALGDHCHFEAEFSVGFRVSDPVEIVRRGIPDGLAVVRRYLLDTCWPVTRRFVVEDAERAEAAVNARLRDPAVLEGCITLFACRARLLPDAAARAYLRTREETRRANTVNAARHVVDVDDAVRADELATMRQQAEQNRRARERDALAARPAADWPLNFEELLRMHLERHPDSSERVLALMVELEKARTSRVDQQDERWRGLFEFLVERDLVQPVDIDQLRNQTMQRLQGAATRTSALSDSSAWDDPLPSVGPWAEAPNGFASHGGAPHGGAPHGGALAAGAVNGGVPTGSPNGGGPYGAAPNGATRHAGYPDPADPPDTDILDVYAEPPLP